MMSDRDMTRSGQKPGTVSGQTMPPAASPDSPPLPGWRSDPLAEWLMVDLHRPNAELDFLGELGQRLQAEGLSLQRVFVGLLSLHPLFVSRNLIWSPGQGAREIRRDFSVLDSDFYLRSPIYEIHRGATMVRQRLDVPENELPR